MELVTAREVLDARQRIGSLVQRTPIETSRTLSRAAGAEIFLKCENLQKTGSFKVRGALNRILRLSAEERARGVVAASAGNHAQGVAYAGGIAGVAVTVVMPETAAITKIEATKGYGAKVLLRGRDYAGAFQEAERIAAEQGTILVHAYDDPDVIAGQGTVGFEILEEVPALDAIVVPVGGGGLVAGITVAARSRIPDIRIIGVQPALASTLLPSLAADRRLEISPALTIADGLATSGLGMLSWGILHGALSRAVTVSEGEIAAAVLLLAERAKMIVEGAAATALAACLGPLREDLAGKRVALVLSGGNIDVNLLDRIINLGLAEHGRVLRFATILPDRPGALSALASVLASVGANIKTIRHDRGLVGLGILETAVTIEVETRGPDHVVEVTGKLRDAGYQLGVKDRLA